jgi:hypothetical protein
MEAVGVVFSLVIGTVVVVMALREVLRRDGAADVGEAVDSVEHVQLRRLAEARISSLSYGAIRLAEKEHAAAGTYRGDAAPAREFWRRFAAASASVEGDPAAALDDMRNLPGLLEEALAAGEGVAADDAIQSEGGR